MGIQMKDKQFGSSNEYDIYIIDYHSDQSLSLIVSWKKIIVSLSC